MNMTLAKAQTLIGGILSELEKDTGQFVVDLDIIDIETTQVQHTNRQVTRHVSIELHRLPGTNWGK
ncbi:hypothetical protein [Methylophaga sp. OBS4]|uniref:hypothetical protein n=1 Tax=Methylophaga sp. OBS4 TaxID=2991935 RepID=UPI00224EECAB|nr:hypothetical protein [Methylophaga sp. OBS4]MCX4186739.1 hypothetical protein [Methylophaga sp. OBS4]